MVGLLWTGVVRAIGVLTAALAVGVIVVSLQAARAQAGPSGVAQESPEASEADLSTWPADAPDEGQPMQPVRAAPVPSPSPETSEAAAVSSPTSPTIREAPPSDALPATRARSLSGETRGASQRPASLATNRRLAAVVDVGAAPPVETLMAALLAKQSLEAQGYDVSLVQEDDPAGSSGPLRPDAYVSLRTAADVSTQAGVEAWFCQVDGSLSGQLADLLLQDLAAAGLPVSDEGDGEIADPQAFQCSLLLAGRARMPAVLLEVPSLPSEDAEGQPLGQSLADGVDQFFQKYRASLLRLDRMQRLVWPATGPITSEFGPSHPLGIDIGQSSGPVVAATDGVVMFAGGNICCSYGLYVVVESADGIVTLYGHLDSIAVAEGQKVRQGEPLGIVGCTGHCYGTHLHFEVIDGGVRRNPMSYLP
jgi:murein DD-endopeptidase MepM/ murein hydrolase activator NlpD